MSTDFNDEKQGVATIEQVEKSNVAVTDVKVVVGSETYNEALLKERPSFGDARTWMLIGVTMLGFFCQTMNGYDGSLFGGLTANKQFLAYFHGTNDGIWAGLVSSMYQIGSVCALPFVGPAIDTWGRKWGMAIGSFLVILGTLIAGLTLKNPENGAHMFMGARFLLGFGVAIASSAGPIYVVETSHPAFRSVVTGYANTFWFTGSILASGAIRGAVTLNGVASWQIPVWLQMFFPCLICISVWTIPESPRWLYVHGKQEQAIATLVKWHGNGNPDSVWVKLQMEEYSGGLNLNGADKRWWDYRALFATRTSCYRLYCNCAFAIFAQWAGNSVLSYFLPAVLTTAGYTTSISQTNINLISTCVSFLSSLVGAAVVERIGRRPMMLFAMGGCCLIWIAMSTATGIVAAEPGNKSAASATVAFIFLFGIVYSVGLTPLQALYPVEVLSFEMRAKGMAFSSLSVSIAGLLGQFAWPVALANIGWHTYIIFIVWCAVQFVIMYYTLPETRKRTLEELDYIFASKNPVQTSLRKHKVALDSQGTIVGHEEL